MKPNRNFNTLNITFFVHNFPFLINLHYETNIRFCLKYLKQHSFMIMSLCTIFFTKITFKAIGRLLFLDIKTTNINIIDALKIITLMSFRRNYCMRYKESAVCDIIISLYKISLFFLYRAKRL